MTSLRRAALLAFAAWVLPLGATEPRRYLVTRSATAAGVQAEEAAKRTDDAIRTFQNVNAFAVDLTDDQAEALRRAGGVERVDPVVPRSAFEHLPRTPMAGTRPPAVTPAATWDTQTVPWGIDMVNAQDVWDVSRGQGVNVAVLDTGVSWDHPDLAHAWAGGYNVFEPGTLPRDRFRHGTHVAGTIAAADNSFGVVGVAPAVTLWGVKVLDDNGEGTDETVAAGIDWVITQSKLRGGRWIINLSLGADVDSEVERNAIYAALANGIVVVASSGNMGSDFPLFPAGYDGVISVGAIDPASRRVGFSSYGRNLSVMAPGVQVESSVTPGLVSPATVVVDNAAVTAWDVRGSAYGRVEAAVVACGLGRPEDFPASVRGRIALITRGELDFRDKARNAKAAGAVAVIIANNTSAFGRNWSMVTDDCVDPLCATDPDERDFPLTVGVLQSAGELLAAYSGKVTLEYRCQDYQGLSGTSMSAPHVTGIAALMLSLDLTLSPAQIGWIIAHTATDIDSPGWDRFTAWGSADALRAAQWVAPHRFGVEAPIPHPTGRRRSGG